MNDDQIAELTKLEPVEPSRPKTPVSVLLAALLLGAVVVTSSVLAAVRGPGSPGPPPSPPRAPEPPTKFGPGTRARIDALRDRAASGLLALRRPEGDFTIHPGAGVELEERMDATAMGILGLTVAKRMGSKVPGIATAITEARALLFRAPKRGTIASANRNLKIKMLAATVLALSIGDEPVDRGRLKDATEAFVKVTDPGPPMRGWAQGIGTRAFAEIIDSGHGDYLGPDPLSLIPIWDNLRDTRDGADQRVSEAFAQAVRSGPAGVPAEIFARINEDSIEWNGAQTDLERWTLRAWLAARVPGGDAWFARALPALEKAVGPDGRVEGEMYGYPVARSAQILLILWEGLDLRAPTGP